MRNRASNQPAVLIVEDDPDAQINLQDILELDGYEVELASSVKEVTAYEDLSEFDAILLDRRLPDGSGDDLLPYIREAASETAVILITGHANLEGAVRALRHGAVDFLSKPIEPEAHMDQIREQYRLREELAESQRKLIQSERLAAIGQAMTVLSHEARNELSAMGLMVQLLPQLDDQNDIREMLDDLKESINRLQCLFEDVREFAAPIHLETTYCDLRIIWRQAWSSLERTWKHRDVVFEEEVGHERLPLPGDMFRLEEVFRNLFENSLAACSDPAVISISRSQTHDNKSISLTIRDNGPGLTEEQKQKIFEAFYTTKSQGTGLGMAIVKRIIEAHGGTICVGEEAFQGAEFVITLPLDHRNPVAKEPACLEANRTLTMSPF
jgi:signal transduction histidine kinase